MITCKGTKAARTHLRLNLLSALALAVMDVTVETRRGVPTAVPCTPREDQLTGLTHALCLVTTPARRTVDLSGSAQAYEARRFTILSQAIPSEERASQRAEVSAQRHSERIVQMGGTIIGVVTDREEQALRDRLIELGGELPGRITEREELLIQEREKRIAAQKMAEQKKSGQKKGVPQLVALSPAQAQAAAELQSRRDYADWLERYVAGEDEQVRRFHHLERQQSGLSALLATSRAARRLPLPEVAVSAQTYLRRHGMAGCPVDGKCIEKGLHPCTACNMSRILREVRAEERRRLDATETPREARIRRALSRVRRRLQAHKLRHGELMNQHASGTHVRAVESARKRLEGLQPKKSGRRMRATELSVPGDRVYRIEVPEVRLRVGQETWRSPATVLLLDVSTLDAEQLADLDYVRTLTVNPVSWSAGVPRSKGAAQEAAWAGLMRALPEPKVVKA